MDRIMPIDLEHADIKKVFRGFDPNTVDALLSAAASTIQGQLNDLQIMREQNERLRFEQDLHRSSEDTLKQTLFLAQKTADETRAAAQRQGDLIIEEARQAALAERIAGHQAVSQMRWEVERLRSERDRYQSEMRDLLTRQLREIEAITPTVALVDDTALIA